MEALASDELIMPRRRSTCTAGVTVLHTASLPTASSTGTLNTGLLCVDPPIRSHPTTAVLTGTSTVNHVCPQSAQNRLRTVTFGSFPFVADCRTARPEHFWHCIATIALYPATVAPCNSVSGWRSS